MRALVTALGVIAAAGGVASANEYELGMGMGVRRMGSASVDALSADDRAVVAQALVTVMPGIGPDWLPRLEAAAEVEHAHGAAVVAPTGEQAPALARSISVPGAPHAQVSAQPGPV